ncbi:MAG: sulfotransferase [Gammaproteobacteria bacterium]|nr:sulfotransferase [Gammaproteobacteria bacterium]
MSYDLLLHEALQHYQEGNLNKAEDLCARVLDKDPDNTDACHLSGIIANQTGRNALAIRLLQKVIQNSPNFAEAYYNLANALRDSNQFYEAINNYKKAVSLKPDYAEAFNNIGLTYQQIMQPEIAIPFHKQALSINPNQIVAYLNLAHALNETGNQYEAIRTYQQALAIDPTYADVYYNLANIHSDTGNIDEAISCYKNAIKHKPDLIAAYNNMGHLLKDFGHLNEAIHAYKQAICFDPQSTESFRALSRIKIFSTVDDDIKTMEKLYSSAALPARKKIHLAFALGKAFEDLKEYDKAFNYFLEGNYLNRLSYAYSITNEQKFFERVKQVFSADFFSSHKDTGNPDTTPIFIVGMPRSGSTLVEQILASHPNVHGAGEQHYLISAIDDICSSISTKEFPRNIARLDPDQFSRMGSLYLYKTPQLSNTAKYITDKLPENFFRIGLIKAILPNARIIHCVRDPMDTCCSIFKNYFNDMNGYAYDLEETGHYYNLYRDLMNYWHSLLPDFIYDIHYEDLVTDQKVQSQKLLEFCNLEWDENCLAFYNTQRRVSTASAVQVRKPVYADSIQSWKHYQPHLDILKKILLS